MIDERVLNSIISTFNDPSFSVFIKDISQNNECNKDEIIVSLEQVTPNLYKLLQTKEYVIDQLINLLKTNSISIPSSITNRNKEHINTIVEKKMILDSNLAINDDKTMRSEINGYVDILGYGQVPIQKVTGKIRSRLVEIKEKGIPVYIPIDRFKVRDNVLYITIPNDIKDVVVKIDKQNKQYTRNGNVLTVPSNGIHQGNHTFSVEYVIKNDITTQNIEVIVTPIAKEVEIDFTEPHKEIPAIILTVDKKDMNLYTSYTTEFIYDKDIKKYTGVKIAFKNLRRKASYPKVNICILGE